jgi:ribokinase
MLGAVGDDDLGAQAVEELAAEGVDVGAVSRVAGVASGVALIVVDRDGENQIAVASGANAELSGQHVGGALGSLLAGEPGVVLLSHEVGDDALGAAAGAAADAGWTVVLNPAPARAIAAAVLEARPIVTPNAAEAAQLTGEAEPRAAARALAARTGAPVLVTLGARGALLGDEEIPAPRVRAVDTTGAGDTVNGALAAELAAGRELADAARFAVAAAALSTRAAGARGGMPRRDEVR